MRIKTVPMILAVVLIFTVGLYVGAQNTSTIPTFTSGQILTAAELNAMGDAVKELLMTVGLMQADVAQLQNDVLSIESIPVGNLTVFDVNGIKVGDSIGLSERGNPLISMSVEGRVFVIGVLEDRFFVAGSEVNGLLGRLYWDGEDCTGTPLISPSGNGILSGVRVSTPGNTIYLEDIADGVARLGLSLSVLTEDGVTCFIFINEDLGVPAVPLIDLYTLFTPPFSIVRRE